jgi:DNA-directed RNA polymerase subunit RPC12/RpoP
VRFSCPCGAQLKIPAWQVDGHGICPRCRRRLLLTGKADARGQVQIHPLVLGEHEKSGRTFMIEDHFREMPEAQDKIAFHCPCGRKLFARPAMLDRRGKCPECNARLLLVGKTNARTQKLEIHPLVLDEAGTGDTMVIEG